jgi:hypothetical protein
MPVQAHRRDGANKARKEPRFTIVLRGVLSRLEEMRFLRAVVMRLSSSAQTLFMMVHLQSCLGFARSWLSEKPCLMSPCMMPHDLTYDY